MDNPPQNPITRFCPEDRKRLEENTDKMPLVHVGLACMTMMIISTTTFLMCDRPTWLICSITWMPVKDDICTICSSPGDLYFCSRCPRGFHVPCLRLADTKDVRLEESRDP